MNSLLNRIKSRTKNKPFSEDDLIRMWHDFNCCYGFIPRKELKKIPLKELWELWEYVCKEKEMKIKQYQATMALAGVKKDQW